MGMIDQFKEAMRMRSEMKEVKRMQNEIMKATVSHTNGGITVVVRGDMLIESITVEPGAYDEVKAGRPSRFETMLLNVANAALKKAREMSQQEMQKVLQANGGLSALFGK